MLMVNSCMLAYFERTRTPLTSFIHFFRFPMMLFSSAMLKPVSFRSWSTYVVAGLPLFLAPCFGSQSSRSLITSSFFLQQCPINRSLLIISVSVILGRLPYSSLLVLCSFQETPRTALSILVYVPSSLFLIFPVIVSIQHHKAVHFQLWPERNLFWDDFLGLISTLSSFCWVHSKLVQFLYSCPFTGLYPRTKIFEVIYFNSVWQDLLQVECWLYSTYSVFL